MSDRLTPDEARAKFGELLDPKTKVHMHFGDPEGDWRPEMVRGPSGRLELTCYRLYRLVRKVARKPTFRPRGK